MAAPMKWTCEMEEVLIEEIKNRRQLWDHRNKFYKLRKLKQASYEEIAGKMNDLFPEFTVATIISKFSNLKTVYQRNKKKLQFVPSGSGSAGFAVPWTHFQKMQFLDNVEPVEPSTSNLDLSLQDMSDSEMSVETVMPNETSEQLELLVDVPRRPVVSRKRKRSSPEHDLLIKACET